MGCSSGLLLGLLLACLPASPGMLIRQRAACNLNAPPGRRAAGFSWLDWGVHNGRRSCQCALPVGVVDAAAAAPRPHGARAGQLW
jgi:hypothetical protein